VRDREELLSVFPATGAEGQADRAEAAEVLDALIGSRLLTAYEQTGELAAGGQQVEIVHESLLQAWPRLVRWQTQDADGAQLRHQLRQAAQLWHERGRAEDLLWSGTAYRDFTVWRERYSGGLTTTEEAFAEAAARRDGRRRRRRRLAVAAALVFATFVAAGALGLWRRADQARQRAEGERLRAEAGRLLALGERDVDRHPTGALAFALKSLEFADTTAGRLLALRVLQQSPVARIVPAPASRYIVRAFSPDGEWLAAGDFDRVSLLRRSGGAPRTLFQYPSRGVSLVWVGFRPRSDILVTDLGGDVRQWSVADGRELLRAQLGHRWSHLTDRGLFTETMTETTAGVETRLAMWPYTGDRPPAPLGTLNGRLQVDSVKGSWFAYAEGRRVFLRSFDDWLAPPRRIVELASDAVDVTLSDDGSRLAASDATGRIEVWSTRSQAPHLERILHAPGTPSVKLDSAGRRLAASGVIDGHPTERVFDLGHPVGTEPLVISRGDTPGRQNPPVFDPSGQWLSTASPDAELWWIGGSWPRVLVHPDADASALVFTPDGRWLLAAFTSGIVNAFPMMAADEPRTISTSRAQWRNVVAVSPSGRQAAVGLNGGRLLVVDLEGARSRSLAGFPESSAVGAVAFGGDGRLVAAGIGAGPREEKLIRVVDLQSGATRTFGPLPGTGNGMTGGIRSVAFVARERVVALVEGVGLVLVDLQTGATKLLSAQPNARFQLGPHGMSGVGLQRSDPEAASTSVIPFDLERGSLRPLPGYENPRELALDPTGTIIATGSIDGSVRVGRLTGGAPHVLMGHRGAIKALAFSPDGHWLASASADSTIRIWPVPDVSRVPLHKLSYEELLARLRSYTNLRAVADESAIGYALKPGPFPGWATPPIQ
jgi:WD40 repeat protein